MNAKEIAISREIIKMEIQYKNKLGKYTLQEFYRDMTQKDINGKSFSERTVRRYLSGSNDAGKDYKIFLRLSLEVLELYEVEMLEMIKLYLDKEDGTVTFEIYEKEIRSPALEFRQHVITILCSPKYKETEYEFLDRNSKIVDILKRFIDKSHKRDLNQIIALYNTIYCFSDKMKLFWIICLYEIELSENYFIKLDKKISTIKVNLSTTKDYRLLLEINSGDLKRSSPLNIEKYKEKSNDINGLYLFCAVQYFNLKCKYRALFLEIALKYTFLKKTKGIL